MVKRGKADIPVAAGGAHKGPGSRLGLVLGALIALEGGALALKAFDEKQAADTHRLVSLQRESIAMAERLDGRINTARAAMQLGQKAGAGHDLIAGNLDGVDLLLSLRDAAQSPAGSRIRAAADTAINLVAERRPAGLTADGDIVLALSQQGYPTLIGFGESQNWLGENAGSGPLQMALRPGDAALDQPRVNAGDGSMRSATACSPVASGAMTVCVTRPAPMFTQNEVLRLLTYALLLAAPTLAILGLMRMIARGRADEAGAHSRAQSAETELELLMSGARAGAWSWDPARNLLSFSDKAGELMGCGNQQDISLETLMKDMEPRERERVDAVFARASETGWICFDLATPGGQGHQFVELRAAPAANGRFAGIVIDITEQKLSDLKVRRAERRLRSAMEGFSGPFALWDARKRLIYWNRAFALSFHLEDTLRPGIGHDTVGVARAGAVRREVASLEDTDTSLLELQSGRWIKLIERRTPDGGHISLGIDVTSDVHNEEALKRQKSKLRQLVLDLERSEGHAAQLSRKFAEEKAKAEHAANSKTAFLNNMSHELRTPLNAINGFSEILFNELYGPLGDTRYKGYAGDILTSGRHLLDLINSILDMAKMEAGKMEISQVPLDPVEPVDSAVRMLRQRAEEAGIELILRASDDLPMIEADHRAIRQMVLNLVSNALKFTDRGGRVVVSVDPREEELRIAVTDNGVGIPREQINRLGQPFEQIRETSDRNTEGTGLGLALTRSFAEMHGGRLTIASEPGKGTRVTIYLPMRASAQGRNREVA